MYDDRLKIISYKEKKILSVDYSNLESEELLNMLPVVRDICINNADGFILSFANMEMCQLSTNCIAGFNKLNSEIFKYVKKSAVIGISDFMKIGFDVISKAARIDIKIFGDSVEALEWLVID